MPYRPFAEQNCSIADALAIVGERWTLLVMREILLGRSRFREIKRNTGIASNILSDRLETLVEQGLIERRRYSDSADAYEYVPTRKGLDVNPVLVALMAWGDKHVRGGGKGAPRVVVHTACGHDAHPAMHCSHCGEVLDPKQTRVRPGPGANAEQRREPLLPAAAR